MNLPACSESGTGADPIVANWDGLSEESLILALEPPATECVETGLLGRWGRWRDGDGSAPGLGLTITARSAYRFRVAAVYVDALSRRLRLSQDLCERVRTALQEAVVNAVVHGNLGLPAGRRDNLQEIAEWQHTVETLLALDRSGQSAIRIVARWTPAMLDIAIRDSGSGFESGVLSDHGPDSAFRGSGRGLSLICAFSDYAAVTRGESTVEIGFHL